MVSRTVRCRRSQAMETGAGLPGLRVVPVRSSNFWLTIKNRKHDSSLHFWPYISLQFSMVNVVGKNACDDGWTASCSGETGRGDAAGCRVDIPC